MQKEYKEAMERLTLSDDDRARILDNVKKACEDTTDTVVSIEDVKKRRQIFSPKRMGAAAAAVLVLLIGAWMVHSRFFVETGDGATGIYGTVADDGEEVWEELASVDDIATETDCRTYTLGNVSKSYRVKKVEVARAQKHVRITYVHKKKKDKILFEYEEEENASDIMDEFQEETELATEQVGDSEVTMYGAKLCNSMTWQKEECTFAVKMSKACSTEKVKKFVSGTKEKTETTTPGSATGKPKKKTKLYAIGWKGNEAESTDRQRQSVWNTTFQRYGFRVIIEEPAKKVAYKMVRGYESFSFFYEDLEGLQGTRIIGYAGQNGCPSGVMADFETGETYAVDGLDVTAYTNKKGESLFCFVKQDVSFTFLLKKWEGDQTEEMLRSLIGVIRIATDAGDGSSENETDADNSDAPNDAHVSDIPDDGTSETHPETVPDVQGAGSQESGDATPSGE